MARASDRFFRALLRLFPREFRGDFGEQMTADFRDQRDEAARRSRSAAPLWLRTTADFFRRAPFEHLDIFKRDAGYALRLLRRRPGFTASALLTLTLGIGLNTAVYSVVSTVLWRELPLPESDRLVRVFEVEPGPEGEQVSVAPANFLEWQRQTRSLDALTANGLRSLTLTGDLGPERITATAVGVEFLPLVGARLALGRTFVAEDFEAPSAATDARPRGPAPVRSIIIGDDLWRRQFGGRDDVIGRTVLASGASAEIIGVMEPAPPALVARGTWWAADAWVPIEIDGTQDRARYLPVFGRLAPGVSIEEAQAEFDVIAARLAEANPRANKGFTTRVVPLRDSVVEEVRLQLLFLAGAVLAVLLVACANLTTLLLANASGRRDELSTRVALGATRALLIRQTITEGLVLSTLGGLLGLVLAFVGVPLLVAAAPPGVPRLDEVVVDGRVIAITVLVSTLVGLLCGLGASLSLDRVTCLTMSRGIAGQTSRRGRKVRQSLAAAEIGLALMLVVAAGLMVRTVRALGSVELGFDPAGVMFVNLDGILADFSASGRAQRARIESEILERVRAIPGVVAAGIGSELVSGGGMGTVVETPGTTPDQKPTEVFMGADSISTGYFEALGARVVVGRFFEDADATRKPQPVLLSPSAVRALWGGDENPIGKSVRLNGRDVEIVGVAADMRRVGLEAAPGPTVYFHHMQSSGFIANNMLVKTTGDPLLLAPQIRSIVSDAQDALSRTHMETLQQRIDTTIAPRRFMLAMVGGFSFLALTLALVGIYGILAESVAQRVPEIGVRMALGATSARVMGLFLRQGAWIIAIGLALGLAGALAFHRAMTTLVFGVETLDPPTFIGAVVCLVVTGMLACGIPARRAAHLDPVAALRQE